MNPPLLLSYTVWGGPLPSPLCCLAGGPLCPACAAFCVFCTAFLHYFSTLLSYISCFSFLHKPAVLPYCFASVLPSRKTFLLYFV
ncbi:hypothetical protein DW089_03100 [Acidaminococcus sp. AM05-11]|nr:hypothetical protein DW089_03100 [Acidaminococcus sp. AM05-11]